MITQLRLRKSKPSDWKGFGMTVCVAGIAEHDGEKSVVTATDEMVTTGYFGKDKVAMKREFLHLDWEALFAADDVSEVTPILGCVRSLIHEKYSDRFPNGYVSLGEISGAFSQGYNKAVGMACEARILQRYGLTMEKFRDDGLRMFGSDVFNRIGRQIEDVSLGVDFLVCGFDGAGEPHLFTVGSPGIIKVYDQIGFWAVGSGQQSALSSLFFSGYNRSKDLNEAIYRVCEAKFMAESASGVGASTFVSVRSFPDVIAYIPNGAPLAKDIRKAWEREGRPRMPKKIKNVIKNKFGKQMQSARAARQSASQTSAPEP